MGIFDALQTAVSGLSAQSYALQNISGNIANAQTTAYKGINTQFEDLIGTNQPSAQIAGGVIASSVSTNNVQGDIQTATTSTFMAINGNGYFTVQQPTSFSGNLPVFGGTNLYTRRGDFELNQNGYLVNGAGYYLMGIPLDPTTGNPTGSIATTLQFSNNLIPAVETTQIQYQANLPSDPITTNTQTGVVGSNLLNPVTFAADPLVGAPAVATLTGTGATLQPDAEAVGTGTANNLTNATTLTSLGFSNGETITVNDGVDTPTVFTLNTGTNNTVGDLIAAITAGASTDAKVTATLNAAGKIVLTSADGTFTQTDTITSDTVSPTAMTALGFGTGNQTFPPTNLLTQSAVSQGQELIVTIGTNTSTITFGTGGAPQVATIAQLGAALESTSSGGQIVGGSGTVTANGDIKFVAGNSSESITVSGGFQSPATSNLTLSTFGITNTQAFPANGTVYGIDDTNFLAESVAGGSITSYDGTGTPVNMQFRWAQTDSAALGAGHTNTWNLFYQTNTSATNTQAAWTNVGTNFTFNSSGDLTPPLSTLSLPNVTVNGSSLGTVALNFGSGGLTQFSNPAGTVQVNLLNQNGSSAGQLQSIAVDNEGRIIGTYSNGLTEPLAEVTLANFNGQNNLEQLDGGAYQATADSGPPLQDATGSIVGSSLEASNTDIADQFSQLIVTQQAYAANTKIITTANSMISDLLDVVR